MERRETNLFSPLRKFRQHRRLPANDPAMDRSPYQQTGGLAAFSAGGRY
jgi:hypothetical protein